MDDSYWTDIPQEIQSQIKRNTQASDWAAKKRAEVADAWAREQRRYGDALEADTRESNPFAPSPSDYQGTVEDQQYGESRTRASRYAQSDYQNTVEDQDAGERRIRAEQGLIGERISEGARARNQEYVAEEYPKFQQRVRKAQEIWDGLSEAEKARLARAGITQATDLIQDARYGPQIRQDAYDFSTPMGKFGDAAAVALGRIRPESYKRDTTQVSWPEWGARAEAVGKGYTEGLKGEITPAEQQLVTRLRQKNLIPKSIGEWDDVEAANYLRGAGVTPDMNDEVIGAILSFADPVGGANFGFGGIKKVGTAASAAKKVKKATIIAAASESEAARIKEIQAAVKPQGIDLTDDEALKMIRGQEAAMKKRLDLQETPPIPAPTNPTRDVAEHTQRELGARRDISVAASPTELENARLINRAENTEDLNAFLGKTTRAAEREAANAPGDVQGDIADVLAHPNDPSKTAVDNVRLNEVLIPQRAKDADDAKEAWDAASKDPTLPQSVIDGFRQDYEHWRRELTLLQLESKARGTSAGTALEVQKAFRPLYDRTKPSTVQQRIIDALHDNAKRGPDGKKIKVTEEEVAAKLKEFEDLMAKDPNNVLAQHDFWTRLEAGGVNAMDIVGVYNRAAMMSNPSTHITNTFGTAANGIYTTASEMGSDLLKRDNRALLGGTYGSWVGMRRGWAAAKEIMTHGVTMAEASRVAAGGKVKSMGATTSRRMRPGLGRSAVVALEMGSDRPAAAADALNHAIIYNMELGRESGRLASAEGLRAGSKQWRVRVAELMAKPTEAIDKQAVTVADDVTYRLELGETAQDIGRLRGKNKVTQIVSQVLMPFYKTPVNIWRSGLDMTPGLGALWIGADALAHRGKTVEGNRLLKLRVRDQALGLAVAIPLYQLTLSEGMSAQGPSDPDKRRMLEAEGWQPYSIKIGGKWVQYSNWGPMAIPMAAVAGAGEAVMNRKATDSVDATMADAALRFGKLVKTQSYLQGIAQLFDAFDNGAQAQSAAKTFAAGLPQRVIPYGSAVSGVARAMDPYERTPEFKGPNYFEQRLDTRLPGLRETVPIKQDLLGNRVENTSQGVMSFLPLRSKEAKDNPVIAEYQKYKVDIGQPPDQIGGVKLTNDERMLYQRIMGKQLETAATKRMGQGSYQRLDAVEKQKELQDLMSAARRTAATSVQARIGKDEFARRKKQAEREKLLELEGVD